METARHVFTYLVLLFSQYVAHDVIKVSSFADDVYELSKCCAEVFHLKPSLAIPSWVGAMSTSQRAVTPCSWGVKAGMVHVWVAGKTV